MSHLRQLPHRAETGARRADQSGAVLRVDPVPTLDHDVGVLSVPVGTSVGIDDCGAGGGEGE